MKLNKIILSAGVAISMLSLGSCVKDLDLLPTDESAITPGQFAEDPEGYLEAALADVYMSFATFGPNGNNILDFDGGMTTFQRAVFYLEEVPTDEASWMSTEDPDLNIMTYGTVASNNQALAGIYARLFVNIAICNQFIQTVNDGYFELNTPELQARADEFIRQAKILRGGAYFYAIDLFGNVPWADESVLMGEVAPQLSSNFQEGRTAVFNRVTEDLESIVSWYKANDPNNRPPYGYVGLDVAESILVKFYLNAGVYTGTPAYDKCLSHAEAVIARLGKGGFQNTGLCNSYFQNFGFNNRDFSIGGSSPVNEMIWTIPQQEPANNGFLGQDDNWGLKSWANGTFMCNAWIGNSTADDPFHCNIESEYNSTSGWKCMVCRPQFVETFEWDDETMGTSKDQRVRFWKTSKDGFALQNSDLILGNWGRNGYLAVKFINWAFNDDGSIDTAGSPTATSEFSIDYAVIRLAEIYLSAAEAALQGLGDTGKALTYVNYIRQRAGMDPYTSMDMGTLQQERTRELYTENVRRTDLIRWNKWLTGYTWSWKGNVEAGTDYPSHFNVYAIPTVQVNRNGYTQNPGY